MTSFELFRSLKFNKNLDLIYIFIVFSPKIDYVRQVTSFHAKKKRIFASNYGIIKNIKIKLCK